MTLKKISALLTLTLFIQFNQVFAQRTMRWTVSNASLIDADKFIDLSLYQQADVLLEKYLLTLKETGGDRQNDILKQEAIYLKNYCALQLNKPHADDIMKSFLNETLFDEIKQRGNFQFANYYFEHSNFEAAIHYYETSGINFLSNKELAKRNFELGYCYLVTQQLDKVDPLFASAKNIPGEYFKPGNYYHGILAYYKKDYDDALKSFNTASADDRYKNTVPFYITEINYLKGNKDKALTDALHYLNAKEKLYYYNELNQLVGQIYFEKDDYSNAENYFSEYISKATHARAEDYYRLAYSQYQQGTIESAIQNIEAAPRIGTTLLSQQMDFLLANCYLKTGDKEKAYDAFLRSIKNNSNEQQKELSEFTLAKLSYDKGDDALARSQLNYFIKKYPSSPFQDEANELLAYLNIKTANFDDAIIAMNRLKNLSPALKNVYQKANYARGVQMLIAENPEKAIFNFVETKKFPVDETINTLSNFWLSECTYRLGKYEDASEFADLFLTKMPIAGLEPFEKKMHLLKAYVYFQKNDNEKLNQEFALATNAAQGTDPMATMGTFKSNYIPEKIPIIDNDPYIMVYDIPDEKINFQYHPIPLKPIALSKESLTKNPNYLKIGLGNLSSILLETGLALDELVNMPLYIDFSHTASSGKIKFQDAASTHVGVTTHGQLKHYRVESNIALDRTKYMYYGYNHSLFNNDNVDLKQVFQNFGIHVNATPSVKNSKDIDYKLNAYTGIYTDRHNAGEWRLNVEAPISKQLDSVTVFHSDLALDFNEYFVQNQNAQTNAQLLWRPSITKHWTSTTFNIGVNTSFGQKISFLPNIHAQINVGKQRVAELAYTSEIHLNTFKQMSELNPFMFNYYTVKQSKNTDIFIGVKGNTAKNLAYSSRIGFAIYKNLPLFLNDTASEGKQFKLFYEPKATAFLLDVNVDYTIHSEMRVGASLRLRPILNLKNSNAWHYIPAEFDLYGKIRLTQDVSLKADIFYRAGSKVIEKNALVSQPYVYSQASGFDANLSLRYQINSRWDAFFDISNLFGSKYARWNDYPVYGTNALIGITHSFKKIKFSKQ